MDVSVVVMVGNSQDIDNLFFFSPFFFSFLSPLPQLSVSSIFNILKRVQRNKDGVRGHGKREKEKRKRKRRKRKELPKWNREKGKGSGRKSKCRAGKPLPLPRP